MKTKMLTAAAAAVLLIGISACEAADTTDAPEVEVETTETVEEAEVDEASDDGETDSGGDLTVSQQNAVAQAENYLSVMAFSRQGLIDQLVFEEYPEEDATLAVDSLDVDWNEQAARKAQEYLDAGSFSRQGLIDQLIFEGFTDEEAEYGVDQVGL